jgi:hypothetical protein
MADTSNIYTKLLAFQKLGVSIRKDKKNPHFKNSYADISEVLDKVKAPLTECGITLMQLPQQDGLRTILVSADDGSQVEGFLPFIGATDPQKLGSNLTYLRRYALVAMLGLEDEDDDGNVASTPAPKAAVKTVAPLIDPIAKLSGARTIYELIAAWEALPPTVKKDPEVVAMKDQRKAELSNITE